MTQPAAPDPVHPVITAMRSAPRAQILTEAEHAELAQDLEDLRSGRVQGVAHEDVPAWLEAHARELGEIDE